MIGALKIGAPLGELLGLQWKDVDLVRREITIRAESAKDDETRRIPISDRLKATLDMGRHDPAGELFGLEHFVFGDEVAGRVQTTQKAWQTCVLKAHGHTPEWDRRTKKLVPSSQVVYRAIDLRFHDLRHEADSRSLEAGMSIHCIKTLLGHAPSARRTCTSTPRRFDCTKRCSVSTRSASPSGNRPASSNRQRSRAKDRR